MKNVEFYFLSVATFQVLSATSYGYVSMLRDVCMHGGDVTVSRVCVRTAVTLPRRVCAHHGYGNISRHVGDYSSQMVFSPGLPLTFI